MWLLLLCINLAFAEAIVAQVRTIPDVPACRECAIGLERLVTLQTAHGLGALVGEPKSIARNSQGLYFVVDYRDRRVISVFGPDGVFLRTIGRAGQGPGEFEYLEHVRIISGDSIVAIERNRFQVLSPSGEYARSFLMAGPKYDVVHTGKTFLVAGTMMTRDRVGFPLHEVDLGGGALTSFGVEEVFRPDRMDWGAAMVGLAPEGSVVSVSRNQFVIDQWSASREHLGRFVRATTWFPAEIAQGAVPTRDKPRPPMVTGVQLSGPVALIMISVPHERWSEIVPDAIEVRGARVLPIESGEGYFQTRMEAIDLGSGTLLVARRFDIEAAGFVGEGLLYSGRRNPDGTMHTDVWRVTVTRK